MREKENCILDQGSITVEASLVLPIFILAVVCFFFFFQIILVQETMQSALERTAKYAAEWTYAKTYLPEDEKTEEEEKPGDGRQDGKKQEGENKDRYSGEDLLSTVLLRGVFERNLNTELVDASCLKGGVKGILFLSNQLETSEMIHMTISYRFRIPISMFGLRDIPSLQAVDVMPFVGFLGTGSGEKTGSDEEKEEYVYVTPTGTVYHKSASCSYIKINLSSTTLESVGGLRNSSGGKYYPCESCMKHGEQSGGGILFVTPDGERYHNSVSCSKITRTVKEIPLSEVGGRSPCSRCCKKE